MQDSLTPQDALTLRLDRAARQSLAANLHDSTHLPELATLCLPVTTLWCRVLRHDPTAPDWPRVGAKFGHGVHVRGWDQMG